jgi:hypothetical protein
MALLRIDERGVIRLPKDTSDTVEIAFPSLGFVLRAMAANGMSGKPLKVTHRKVVVPGALRRGLTLPLEVEADVHTYSGDATELRRAAAAIPMSDRVCFRAETTATGEDVLVMVPPVWVRGMEALGWGERVQVSIAERTFIGRLRASTKRANKVTYLALYRNVLPDVKPCQTIDVVLQPISKSCVPSTTGAISTEIDWLAFCDSAVVEERDRLVYVNTKGARFSMLRRTSVPEPAWLLGFYQAEGSKSDGACEWAVTNKSPVFLARTVAALTGALGIAHEDISVEVSYGRTPLEEARERFAGLGVRFCGPPRYTGLDRYVAGTLHIRNSLPLKRIFDRTLAFFLTAGDRLPKEAQAAFALGFMDGDGTVIVTDDNIRLNASGGEDEVTVAHRYLASALGWSKRDIKYKGWSEGATRYLSLSEAIDLLEANAFWPTYSRVRLLYAVAERVARVQIRNERDGTDKHSPDMPQVARFARFADELAATKVAAPAHKVGRKGVDNPIAMARFVHSSEILPPARKPEQ